MLPWRERSLDLSPIEHVWDIIERQLQHHPHPAMTVPVLTQQLQQAGNSMLQSDIRHLYNTIYKTCSRPTISYNTCRRPFSSSFGTKEKNHYCAAARCRPLSSIKNEESPLLRCEIVFTMQVCMQEDQLCAFPQRTTAIRNRAYAGTLQRTCFLDAATMGFCAVHKRVRFTMDYRGGGILVWAGISLGGHTDLHVFHGGTVTGLRYRDEILDPYVRPYAAAIGNDFILMDDNERTSPSSDC
ncbi:transposable element Tcb2 transposase [Trichonephila clavipes]|nr:transposable element Tcb2 transposase [Trichonephila clavipes]